MQILNFIFFYHFIPGSVVQPSAAALMEANSTTNAPTTAFPNTSAPETSAPFSLTFQTTNPLSSGMIRHRHEIFYHDSLKYFLKVE